ncbi:hypothetical protein METSCH_A00580 [Metschnikowia aff. pulcherrima]|uniref:Uncharacterized protein n=1 Tax=Metschnikowia aff. pulcherrima TaxID=2163413 RepID=A0A4P6XDD5_9ASCO|nr:hypothetical protein METSCH_A00580 [Metschnikowia aff. pulcherrima]
MSLRVQPLLSRAAKELYPLITNELSNQSPKKYNNDAWSLSELDSWKNIDLPNALRERHQKDEDLHITKTELTLLMDWKLRKGKFRPNLSKLISSNSDEAVIEISREGFAVFTKQISLTVADNSPQTFLANYKKTTRDALKIMCQLKGVGPATASLLLSLLSKVTMFAPPFFSDESFMYFVRDVLRPRQPIKYNVKEYIEEFIPVIIGLSTDDKFVSPNQLEQGAWALKTFDLYKTDRLADIKVPFAIEENFLYSFKDAPKYLAGHQSKKRSAVENDERIIKRKHDVRS